MEVNAFSEEICEWDAYLFKQNYLLHVNLGENAHIWTCCLEILLFAPIIGIIFFNLHYEGGF